MDRKESTDTPSYKLEGVHLDGSEMTGYEAGWDRAIATGRELAADGWRVSVSCVDEVFDPVCASIYAQGVW